jgi:hypothetical protein
MGELDRLMYLNLLMLEAGVKRGWGCGKHPGELSGTDRILGSDVLCMDVVMEGCT